MHKKESLDKLWLKYRKIMTQLRQCLSGEWPGTSDNGKNESKLENISNTDLMVND